MDVTTISLSTEELALILAQLGHAEASNELIVAQLGPQASQAEIQASMLAAAHGLLADGWLDLAEDGDVVIDPELQRIVGALTEANVSMRYSRADPSGERLVTYHIAQGRVLEHTVEYGLVHVISELPPADAILDGGMEFLEVAEAASFAAPPFDVPLAVLSEIKDSGEPGVMSQRLQQAGVPEAVRPLLVEDLAGTQYRGAALRVEYGQNAEPFSDRGLLLLRGPQRLWLMRQNADTVTMLPGTEASFRQEVAALLR